MRVVSGAAGEAAFEHRPVKRGDPALTGQPRQQRRVVAVADEQLRMPRDLCAIEQRQQVHAAIPAAHRQQRGHGRIDPVSGKGSRPNLRRPGKVAGLLSKDGVIEHRHEPEPLDFGNAARELVAVEWTGRGHDGDGVARLQGSGFAHGC